MSRGASRLQDNMVAQWAPHYLRRLARVLDPILTGSLAAYASQRCPQLTFRQAAMHRVDALYAARSTLPLGIHHVLIWWIDTHMPLLMSSVTGVAEAYRRQLAPCQSHAFPQRAVSELVHVAWTDGAVPGDGERCKIKKSGPIRAARRLVLASAAAARKLLRKGSVLPPSRRNIGDQLGLCTLLPGIGSDTARAIMLMHVLGLYPNRRVIMPPRERLAVYGRTTTSIYDEYIKPLSSQDVYNIVATFVVWATRPVYALWTHCCKQYRTYIDGVLALGIEYGVPSSQVQPAAQPPLWQRVSTHACFLAALNIKKKIPGWVQAEFVSDLVSIERCAKVGALLGRLTTGGLQAAGLAPTSIQLLVQCVATKAAAELVLAALPRVDRARLYLVLLSASARAGLTVVRLSEYVAKAQEAACMRANGERTVHAAVCLQCGTWRPKSRTIAGLIKATSGVVVDMRNDAIRCNACEADWSVVPVSMVGHAVHARNPRPMTILLCAHCAKPSSPIAYVGCLPFCVKCVAAERILLSRFGRCVICNSDGKRGRTVLLGCIAGGRRTTISVCHWHAAKCRALGPTRTIEAVRTILPKQWPFFRPKGAVRFGRCNDRKMGRR
jgi:hypothetical protein